MRILTGDAWRWTGHSPRTPAQSWLLNSASVVDYFGLELAGRELEAAGCEEQLPFLLLELLGGLRELHQGRRKWSLVFRESPRELILARHGDALLVSVLVLEPDFQAVLYDQEVAWPELLTSVLSESQKLLEAIQSLLPEEETPGWPRRLQASRRRLSSLSEAPPRGPRRRRVSGPAGLPPIVARRARAEVRLSLEADRWLRTYRRGDGRDLHALLGRGALALSVDGEQLSPPAGGAEHPVLALQALAHGLESSLRQGGPAANLGIPLALNELADLALAAAEATRALTAAICDAYPHQRANRALHELRALGDELHHLAEGSSSVAAVAVHSDPQSPPQAQAPIAEGDDASLRRGGSRLAIRRRWHWQAGGLRVVSATAREIAVFSERGLEQLDPQLGVLRQRREQLRWVQPCGELLVLRHLDGRLSAEPGAPAPACWETEPGTVHGNVHVDDRSLALGPPHDLLVDAGQGELLRLELHDGHEHWRSQLPTKGALLPAWCGATPIVAAERGEVWALDATTGKRRWRARTPGGLRLAPRALGAQLLVATGEHDIPGGAVLSLDPEDGSTRWVQHLGVAVDALLPTRDGGLLVASRVEEYATLTALSGDGAVRWQRELEYLGVSGLAAPLVAGDLVLVKSDDHRLHALELGSGETRWRLDFEGERCLEVLDNVAPIAHEGILWAAADTVYAIELGDGRILAKVPPQEIPVPSAMQLVPTQPRPTLLICDDTGHLVALALSRLSLV